MQDFHQKPVPENIQAQVTALGSAMGTVPSGKTLQGQVDTLNSNIANVTSKTETYNSIYNFYSNTSLQAIANELNSKRMVNKNVMIVFSFAGVTGFPTLVSGVCIAIASPITSAITFLGFYNTTIESVNVTPT